ncbi:MAG TPA: hypothetical protein VGP70_10300 [Actinomadura sp.]|jgi:hypothetical protein|nr:hypothetical protein [Mycobacteriales bacterium]HEV7932689.1 hypothetical protein [Actinomadura sp.]
MNKTVEMAVRAAGHAGEAVVRRAAQYLQTVGTDGHDHPETGNRWRVVTINKSADEICPGGKLPAPLAELGDTIEWTLRPAPGDKGTELAVRLRAPEPSGVEGAAERVAGTDPRQQVRTALRHAKMLVETGEILQPDRPGSTHPSPLGMPIRLAVKRARGEGLL